MRVHVRLSLLIFPGLLLAGSTALGYYYYYVYSPPLELTETFLAAVEAQDRETLSRIVLVRDPVEPEELRPPTSFEISSWLLEPFERGRVLDQRLRAGDERSYHYLVYREPDGQVYALMATESDGHYHIVVPPEGAAARRWFLWGDYDWTN